MRPAIRVTLVGALDAGLRRSLKAALQDHRVRYDFVAPLTSAADVVLAVVRCGEEHAIIPDARAIAPHAPVLAILPSSDGDLAQRVLRLGAQAWFALDTPVGLLRAMVLTLTAHGRAAAGDAN
jgi:hypothetical protein